MFWFVLNKINNFSGEDVIEYSFIDSMKTKKLEETANSRKIENLKKLQLGSKQNSTISLNSKKWIFYWTFKYIYIINFK